MQRTRTCLLSLLLIVVVLTGCAGGTDVRTFNTDQPATSGRTPEQIHSAYLKALRLNDRATLKQLTDPDGQTSAIVSARLKAMQYEMSPSNPTTGGGLATIQVLRVVDDGGGKRGYSRWVYARTAICHEALLSQDAEGGWLVSDWTAAASCAE